MQAVIGKLLAIPVLVAVEVGGLALESTSDVDVGSIGHGAKDVDITIIAISSTVIAIDRLA